jgi:hypothetical protein
LSGQKITNQEFMKMLTEGNPNTKMPLDTINKLLNYQGAQIDYDKRFNRTKTIALGRGANPQTVDSDIGSVVDRGNYVESRAGVRPPLTGGQSSGGAGVDVPKYNDAQVSAYMKKYGLTDLQATRKHLGLQ